MGFCAGVFISVSTAMSAFGQINIGELNPASVYDAGILQDGSLDSGLWQGVSTVQASNLINNIDMSATGSARSLIRAALLSGGVPPQAGDSFEREAYVAARLSAVLALGNFSSFDDLVNRSDINRANPVYTKIFVERALLGGDMNSACAMTDNIITARKSPYWAKLRAFCHVVRNEIPAAELTADLLVRSGHEDKAFFVLLGKLTGTRPEIKLASIDTPLQIAMLGEVLKVDKIDVKTTPLVFTATMALDVGQDPADRLTALLAAAHLLDAQQIRSVLASLTDTPPDTLPYPVMEPAEVLAKKTWDVTTWGGAYLALGSSVNMDSSAALVGALLAQADKHGQLPAFTQALKIETGLIPAQYQAKFNLGIFARAAVLRGDKAVLRGLFQTLEASDPLRQRIALAADALNNGFVFGKLGRDIETRLAGDGKIKVRAVRDSFIAVAMGAHLSREAETVLQQTKLEGRALNPGEFLALQAAARRGSKAEIALRTAHMIDGEPLRADAFAALLGVLTRIGMHEQAGKLAALDILTHD